MSKKDGNVRSGSKKALRWPLRTAAGLVRLPKHVDTIHQLYEQEQRSQDELKQLRESVSNLKEEVEALHKHLTSVDTRFTTSLSQQENKPVSTGAQPSTPGRFADDHSLDNFYVNFEDKFRGNETKIKKKVEIYPKYLKELGLNFRKYPTVDLGCGRGELLASLTENGIRAIGLDINHDMVKRAKENGLEAVQGDALAYLSKQKAGSLGAITGMHLVEHIPFPELLALFKECYRVLVPKGVVIFETPNPENLIVSIYGFYMDPSHLHPLPPPLLEYALQSVGFTKTEVRYVHQGKEKIPEYEDELLQELANRVYGSFDYAAIATKPGKQTKQK